MNVKKGIHIHWRLLQSGESDGRIASWQGNGSSAALPNLELQGNFCKIAEESGFDSLLVDINYAKPDPTLLTTALLQYCNKLGFIIAVRSGLISPTLFTQQINTLSTFSTGRIYLNVVAGPSPLELKTYGDHLSHDERYSRTGEFLNVCLQFWNNNGSVNLNGNFMKIENGLLKTTFVSKHNSRPYIFIAGGSEPAVQLTLKYGDCLMQLADTVEKIKRKIEPVLLQGKDAGLRLSVICRATHEEAVQAANQLVESHTRNQINDNSTARTSDSQSINEIYKASAVEWLDINLWTGAVKKLGPAAIAIVGSYEEVAKKFIEYKKIGITHFIVSGWPKLDEMILFSNHVMPLIRKMENM